MCHTANTIEDVDATVSLRLDEVHVWADTLDVTAERLQRLGSLLTEEEYVRARGFRFARDRARFVAGRGLLRELLSGYLGIPAGSVTLSRGPYGKPYLQG